MFTLISAALAGTVIGFATAGPMGATFGFVLGMVCGALVGGTRSAVLAPFAGEKLSHERVRLLCVPKGQVAEATFTRDADDGQWLDVDRCSLCTPEQAPGCDKRCLLLLRDSVPRRRHPVPA